MPHFPNASFPQCHPTNKLPCPTLNHYTNISLQRYQCSFIIETHDILPCTQGVASADIVLEILCPLVFPTQPKTHVQYLLLNVFALHYRIATSKRSPIGFNSFYYISGRMFDGDGQRRFSHLVRIAGSLYSQQSSIFDSSTMPDEAS